MIKKSRGLLALGLLGFAAAPAAAAPRAVINDTVWIDGAGTRLFLELRGRDSGPIFLYLHGGPGNAGGLIALRAYIGGQLESGGLVGYLHQRGVIRSPMVPDSALTIANHVADVAAAVGYLANRLPKRPIFLLGHSWGGILAILVALDHPEHLAGIINSAGPLRHRHAMLGELFRTRTTQRVKGAKVPLLVIVGRRDLVTPPGSMRAGYELWGSKKEWAELRDSHHLPFVDEPKSFAAAVFGFALRHSR